MNHLPFDRLVPGRGEPPNNNEERAHLAGCARCRAEARLLADHLSRSDGAPGLEEARPTFQKLRRELSRSFVGTRRPGGSEPEVDTSGARWLRMEGVEARDGAEEIASRVRALGIPAILPWRLDADAVLSRWVPGELLERVTPSRSGRATLVRIFEDVAAALLRLHEHGLVHGDLWGARVLVSRGRGALVLSGLAPGSVAADEIAFQDLAREWLGVDLPTDIGAAHLALIDLEPKRSARRSAGSTSSRAARTSIRTSWTT